jgi:hypothetical protein
MHETMNGEDGEGDGVVIWDDFRDLVWSGFASKGMEGAIDEQQTDRRGSKPSRI